MRGMKKIKNEEVIYYNNGHATPFYLLIMICFGAFQMALVFLLILSSLFRSLFELPEQAFYLVAFIISVLLTYLVIILSKNGKSSYKIYEDRIEYFNLKEPPEKDVIFLSEIDQVRYEDDFGKSYSRGTPNQPFIYCYFINDYKSMSKKINKDRLKLLLSKEYEKEKGIIKILQFFQKKKKQVFISTKSGKIKTALKLENWTDPGIHPSIRL